MAGELPRPEEIGGAVWRHDWHPYEGYKTVHHRYLANLINEGVIDTKGREDAWLLPAVSEALKEPIGTPVQLSPDEAKALALAAFGIDRDLPPGTKYTRQVRKLLWIRREDSPGGQSPASTPIRSEQA